MHDTLHARNFSNYEMKKSTFTIALLLSISSVKAQDISEVKLLPQNDLRKWGVKAGNYSGIANLTPEKSAGEMLSFAIVNDKEKQEGFYILDIKQNARTGEIELVKQSKLLSGNKQTSPHSDAEGIAYAPNTNTIFISYEGSQSILEYNQQGKATGKKLQVPVAFDSNHIHSNYGFEPLTYDAKNGLFWSTTEQNTKSDGEKNAPSGCMLRLQSYNKEGVPVNQYIYHTDKPTAKKKGTTYAFGVSAMTALEDGSLLLLEREFYVAPRYIGSWVNHRIYRINPLGETVQTKETPLKKELVTEFKTTLNLLSQNLANYEGMCLGPQLQDGRRTLLLISDSQDNYGNRLYKMKDYIQVITFRYNEAN